MRPVVVAGPSGRGGVGAQEGSDRLAEFLARVLLQEVAGTGDDRMPDARRAGMARARIGAMPPVIGSRSLNATTNGLSQVASRCQAARLAGAAGSSGVAGTRSGIARGPAW